MATERITVKSSTVFVSVDQETRVFRSVDEVPPEWRKRFERPRGGLKPQTILIADRKGREEIMRSLQGQPSAVQTRWNSVSGSPGAITGSSLPTAAMDSPTASEGRLRVLGNSLVPETWSVSRVILETAIALAATAAVAYAFFF